MHTSIYDLEKRELTVCVQEDAGTIRLRYQDEPYAPVPVTPGKSVTYDTEAEAAKAAGRSAFTPSVEVETKLGRGSDELKAYCGMFGCAVVPTSDGRWAVEATLYPEDWTNVVESAQEATRQIPLAAIAALPPDTSTNVAVEVCCVPGFYYSFYSGGAVTNLRALAAEKGRNVLCGLDGKVEFSGVVKPYGTAGFFTIGVLDTPGVKPSDGKVPVPPVPHPGPYPFVH